MFVSKKREKGLPFLFSIFRGSFQGECLDISFIISYKSVFSFIHTTSPLSSSDNYGKQIFLCGPIRCGFIVPNCLRGLQSCSDEIMGSTALVTRGSEFQKKIQSVSAAHNNIRNIFCDFHLLLNCGTSPKTIYHLNFKITT